jgi:multiple sugar transport system substrate-binding protein
MMKKSLSILLATAFSVSLVACSSSNVNDQTVGTEAPKAGNGNSKPVEITFWDMAWGPASYAETGKKLVEKFNSENPNIKVTYQSTPWANWYQTFVNAIASGSPPDISTGAGFQAFQFTDSNEILPIDDVIEDFKKSGKLDDFVPGSVEALKYNGHYVALPWQIDVRVPWYRKDLFEKAGITTPPKTWDELRASLKKLSVNGNYGLVLPGGDTIGIHGMFTLMLNNGSGLFTADKKVDFMNERNVEAVQYISDLVRDGSINPAMTGMNRDDAFKEFGTGRGAVYFNNASLPDYVPEVKDKLAVLEPLAGPHGEKQTLGWINNIMIYKQSKHPNEAKVFLKWWTENNKPLWTEGKAGGFPAKKSFTQDPFWQNDTNLKLISEKYLPIMKITGNKYPSGFPELNQIEGDGSMTQLVQKILSGKPVKESMQEAEKKIKEIMKEK